MVFAQALIQHRSTVSPWEELYHRTGANFQRKTSISGENSRYILETAANTADLWDAFRLRHEVFFGGGKSSSDLDIDEFDGEFDHLIIREKMTGDVCGTYRIASQEMVKQFYSASEFDLTTLLSMPGNKIEVGRACVAPEHRNGLVIDLLWRGIGQYIAQHRAELVFGCSSVMSVCSTLARQLSDYFRRHELASDEFAMMPLDGYRPSNIGTFIEIHSEESLEELIPPLIFSYLRAGAGLNPLPAVDREFGSIDFLTILPVAKMHPGYKRRYLG